MRVYCGDGAVFATASGDGFRQLLRLFLRAQEGQHLLLIADEAGLLESAFFARLTGSADEMEALEWREVLERAAYEAERDWTQEPGAPPRKAHARLSLEVAPATPPCRWVVTLADAGTWAEQPLLVLVENHRDWEWLHWLARLFRRDRIMRAAEPVRNWLMPLGGGCGEVLNAVRRIDPFHRAFVYADSDRMGAKGPLPTTQAHIWRECEERRIPLHLTRRREKENYLPRSVLGARLTNQKERAKYACYKDHPDPHYCDVKKMLGETRVAKLLEDLIAQRGVSLMNGPEDFDTDAREELTDLLDLLEEHL